LGNGHVDQFIEVFSPNQIQAFLQLGVQSTTESISFLGIRVSMIARILAQVIESLCVLKYSAVSLGKCQKFIELSLNESFWDMVHPKGGLEFFPIDNMPIRLHGMVVVPPKASISTELLGCEESFVCFGARDRE
jgi:hypothetical protein